MTECHFDKPYYNESLLFYDKWISFNSYIRQFSVDILGCFGFVLAIDVNENNFFVFFFYCICSDELLFHPKNSYSLFANLIFEVPYPHYAFYGGLVSALFFWAEFLFLFSRFRHEVSDDCSWHVNSAHPQSAYTIQSTKIPDRLNLCSCNWYER